MRTLSITLPDEMARFVDEEVACGAYGSPSEVVGEGLGLLRRDAASDREKLDILRREVQQGLDDMHAGRLSDRTARSIAEDVVREGSDAP